MGLPYQLHQWARHQEAKTSSFSYNILANKPFWIWPLIAINPIFAKLITSLRTAISDLGRLSKEDASYDNVLDAFRLTLKGIKVVKKEREIE